jgi:glutamyl-tRNA synthetase
MSVRVRFAPSPTGHLHIGNIRTALFNFLFARHHGGTLILRIEDTDPERSRKEFSDSILEDLERIGITWDEGPYHQSERLSIYREHYERMRERGLVYSCYCTEDELAARRKEALLQKRPPRYDNRCRTITGEEIAQKQVQGIRPSVRFKVEGNAPIEVNDLIRGRVSFQPDEIGDFVIMRTHPSRPEELLPTFHMSVCVDDGLMQVSHVIRGEDHLSNTPRHVLLFQAMGFKAPDFAHLSLIHGKGGEPLSKRLASVHVRDFIDGEGYLPDALANYLALLGWSPKDNREVMSVAELVQNFDIAGATRHPAIFNEEKLDWINSEHLRRLGEREYFERARAFLGAMGQQGQACLADGPLLEKSLLLIRNDLHKWKDLGERLGFLPEPTREALAPEESQILGTKQAELVLKAAMAAIENSGGLAGEALFNHLGETIKR